MASALGVVDGMPKIREQLALLKRLVDGSHSYERILGRDWPDARQCAAR
jgi:hypothetical protein